MKTIIAIVFAFFSLNAFAGNDYCDSRPGQTRQSCYQLAIDGHYKTIARWTKETMGSSKVSAAEKEEFKNKYAPWLERIGRECKTMNCEYDSTRTLAMDMRMRMYKLGLAKP